MYIVAGEQTEDRDHSNWNDNIKAKIDKIELVLVIVHIDSVTCGSSYRCVYQILVEKKGQRMKKTEGENPDQNTARTLDAALLT